MSGMFSISSKQITYNDLQPNKINIVTFQRLTDTQRIYLKMQKFFEDLQKEKEILSQTDIKLNILLQYYYLLEERLNIESWESKIQETFLTKFQNIQKAA
ncbi:7089_t:CDS:2 [Cetraspora pellucida]|uniref:7089_t:CDS:1 n=1 Tax=Cetraspora pellucida TaxID=1433469 RepID=A0A9N9FP11_9GLOM|nr:7089_t:CDS:2 [Cetraspora pellucida]